MPTNVEISGLPDWIFAVDERSAGVFEVVATHRSGRSIRKTGIDPEALIDLLRVEVEGLDSGVTGPREAKD